jgi:hypothetical protein
LADWTGAGHAEESLLIAYLAVAIALAALAGAFAGRRARSLAFIAQLTAPDVDFLFHAECRVLETYRQIFADVCATLRATAASTAPSSIAEKIAEAEHLSEQVAEVNLLEPTLSLSSAEASVREGVVSEAVISGALLLVAQYGVSLAALLEALFRFVVAGVAVGVKLQRQLAIGALDLDVTRGASDAEYFVIIAFDVSGQCSKKPRERSSSVTQLQAPGPIYLFGFSATRTMAARSTRSRRR